jgi:hypothetical protein
MKKAVRRTPLQEFDELVRTKYVKYSDPGFNWRRYNDHPLEYAIDHAADYPQLTPYIFDVLLHLVSSCSTERSFSTLTWLLSARRRALTTRNLAAQALINTNMQLVLDRRFGKDVFRLERDLTYKSLERTVEQAFHNSSLFEQYIEEARQHHRSATGAELWEPEPVQAIPALLQQWDQA